MKFAKMHLWGMAPTSPFGRGPAVASGISIILVNEMNCGC